MDAQSQIKVMDAGFMIIRSDDHPSPRIKFKNRDSNEWRTLLSFKTKAERDRKMKSMLEQKLVIND